ncbi:ATP-binding protein [Desulfosediminicola sp.]|uniref:ATP-binding protein n=1 Tax=Desulfosediminicola sp. TaxID=2886825 RepID=UPI003AF31473
MKISIHYKLFAALLAAILAVIIYMTLVLQWSFDRGFLNYINTEEQVQLEHIAGELQQQYERFGSWEWVLHDPRDVAKIVVGSYPEGKFKEAMLRRIEKGRFHPHIKRAGPPPEDLPPHFFERIFLLDENERTIFGFEKSQKNSDLIAIRYQNRVVGYLGAYPTKQLTESQQVVFMRQHRLALILVSVAGVLIAAGLFFPLALFLTRPIRELTSATRELASGKYQTRIDNTSGDELGQLAANFNDLAATLEKNQLARSQWVADISHELRTPLSILRGKVEALQDGVYSPTPELFSELYREVMYLNLLVDDLYQLSLSDKGAMSYNRAEVEPCWALEQAVSLFKPQIEAAGLSLEMHADIESDATLFADNERLKQLFTNLIANSVRYTDPGGRLLISVGQREDSLSFVIEDSAPGVEDQHLERLFERLYRVDGSRSRESGGAGLGLSICWNIVKGHNGTIKATHSNLGGLRVEVTLPLADI